MLNAVVRSPKLIDMYWKQESKVKSKSQIEQARQDAYLKLRQSQVDENNAGGFIKDLQGSVLQSLQVNPKERVFSLTQTNTRKNSLDRSTSSPVRSPQARTTMEI